MPRKKSDAPNVRELKKQLRTLRADQCRPISKMKKEEVLSELSKLKKPEKVEEVKEVEKVEEVKEVPDNKKEKALETLNKFGKQVKTKLREKKVAKAMEGLKKFGKIVKEKIESKKQMKKKAEEDEELSKLKKIENISDKEFKIRKEMYNTLNDKIKDGINKGLKKLDMGLDDFLKSEKFNDMVELRNTGRRTNEKNGLALSSEEKKEQKLYNKLKSFDDNGSVASASDVEEAPKKKKAKAEPKAKVEPKAKAEPKKKGKFEKGSKEAKEYMASLRAKKGK